MSKRLLSPDEYSPDRKQAMLELGKTEQELKEEYQKNQNTEKVKPMKTEKKQELAQELIKLLEEKSCEPKDMRKVLSCAYHIAAARCSK